MLRNVAGVLLDRVNIAGNQNGQQGKSGNGQKKSQPGQGKKGGGKNGNSNAGQGGGSGGLNRNPKP